MLMMRSTAPTKMAKPPPPVPPRPSKDIIAEALAKTRKLSPQAMSKKPTPTARCIIPPPPLAALKRKPSLEKGRVSTRTVVFQSSDIKASKIEATMSTNKAETAEEMNDNNIKTNLIYNTSSAENVIANNLLDEICANISLPDVKTTLISINTEVLDNVEIDPLTVVAIETTSGSEDHDSSTSGCSTAERNEKHVKFDDKKNHEFLIAELENMKKEQERILKRQRKPFTELVMDKVPVDSSSSCEVSPKTKILHSDWVEVNNGKEVRLTSCQITIDEPLINNKNDDDSSDNPSVTPRLFRSLTMSSLHGLPPLPKSLSGFNVLDGGQRSDSKSPLASNRVGTRGNTPPTPGSGIGHVVYPPHPRSNGSHGDVSRKATNLDTQLAILRREMYGLRQLDLSLLSQLWSLNESIQDFRQMLQDQEESALSPPSPSASSGEDGEGDEFYSPSPLKFRPVPPPPPLRMASNSSSATSSEYGASLQ